MSTNDGPGFWKDNCVLIVTGASKGFGRAVVQEFVESFKCSKSKNLILVLSARDELALENLVSELSGHVDVIHRVIGSLDDSNVLDTFEDTFQKVSNCDQAILVHNAGSLGDPSKLVTDYNSGQLENLKQYFAMNVASMAILSGSFLRTFQNSKSRIIVNVSSLAAVSPLEGLSIYCAGKAARDALIRSIVSEAKDVLAINYAPGPLKTAMAEELRINSHMKEFFNKPENLLEPKDSARKLLVLLNKQNIENGSHVDYFDV